MRDHFQDPFTLRVMGEGPRICWVHGLGESSLCFRKVVNHLKGYQHWLVDLPGYGRSPWSKVGTLSEVAAQLIELLEGDSWFLVGHSMGGVIGTFLAEQRPDLLSGFINVDGNISRRDCGYSGPVSEHTLEAFKRSGYEELLDRLYQRGLNDPAHRGYYASMLLAHPASVYQHSCELVKLSEAEVLADRMAALKCPNLYLAGSPGGAAPRSLELLDRAGVTTCLVSESGHWPFIDQPQAFARSATAFFSSCRAGSRDL